MKKITNWIFMMLLCMLCLTMNTVPAHAHPVEKVPFSINGFISIKFMDAKDEDIEIQLLNEYDRVIDSISITQNNCLYSFALELQKGTSNIFYVKQTIKNTTAVDYNFIKQKLQLDVASDGSVQVLLDDENINVPSNEVYVKNFNIEYKSMATYGTNAIHHIVNGTWKKGTGITLHRSESLDFGPNGSWFQITEDDQQEASSSTGSIQNLYRNKEIKIHNYFKVGNMTLHGEELTDVLTDDTMYEVYWKIKDHGDGTSSVSYSYDDKQYYSGGMANLSFYHKLVKRLIQLEWIEDNPVSEAKFDLYRYFNGEPSVDNTHA